MTTPNITTGSVGKSFPTPKNGGGEHKPEPNLIGRRDTEHGSWQTAECRPVRGEPYTDLHNRVMVTPATDDDLARCIRGHELVHAKVSPTPEQMTKFVARQIASQTALIVTEELRVNVLAQSRGFDVKSHLADGGETSDGERLASTGDWAGAVATAISTAGTAGHKAFLNGIRRHNRAWGDALLKISKRAVKQMQTHLRSSHLGSTELTDEGLPHGFYYTEQIAEWVDRLASFPPPKTREGDKKGKKGKGDKSSDSEEGESKVGNDGESEDEGDKTGNPHSDVDFMDGTGGRWAELRVERVPLPRFSVGTIGKKRVATNMGRRPRRLHRLMTDPAKRVFDRTVKGSGGVVIIDASGSMSFTTEQIAEIVENAPGATVLIYSDKNRKEGPNAWVIADKGRMVETVDNIDYGHGNGVDFPAIEWGVANRPKGAPIVWVTDGGVCGYNDRFSDLLAMQCITYARQHGYIVVPHVEEAIEQLRRLRTGGTARSVYPHNFQHIYKSKMGRFLE